MVSRLGYYILYHVQWQLFHLPPLTLVAIVCCLASCECVLFSGLTDCFLQVGAESAEGEGEEEGEEY